MSRLLWYPPKVTTPSRIVPNLQAVLRERGVPIQSFTPGHVMDALLSLGIGLNDEIASIEIGVAENGTGRIVAERDAQGRWEIRETTYE